METLQTEGEKRKQPGKKREANSVTFAGQVIKKR